MKPTGTFRLWLSGKLTLALAAPCVQWSSVEKVTWQCAKEVLDTIAVVAVTPWGLRVRGEWIDARQLVFRVNWAASGLDPLADDAAAMVARPWTISGNFWTPTVEEASHILKLICDATQTETDLVRGGPAPDLQVTGFELVEGELRAGGVATLRVRIDNRGAGTAYRVVATTRSSIVSVHGQRIGFGMVKPGASKTRAVRLTVPPSETAQDAMVVLVVAEGNGFTPSNSSRRFTIKPSEVVPVLGLQCAIAGRRGPRPELNAGEQVVLRCTVDNIGTSVATVSLEIAIADGTPHRSLGQDIAVRGRAVFDVPLVVPRDVTIDSDVEFDITARDAVFLRTARVTIVGVVRKPRLCTVGQLTRAQYKAKLDELLLALAIGDLTPAEFERYDAELVACIP